MENKNKNINERELEILNFWKENKIFEKSLEKPGGVENPESFTFYDGPPFATGLPHHGHILAGTIKDAIPRFQTMNGKRVRRVWGWDCHGLPIENLIEKKYKLDSKKDIEEFGIDNFNKAAEESVLMYEKEWKEIIPRFGRWVDMENAYKTMDAIYTESIWWAFSELNKKGLVFEGYKSMHICPRCETTLAQSEVAEGYKDLTDISVTAKFELEDEKNTFLLAWTTTPWTLPGNVVLAVNGDEEYVKVEVSSGEKYILAKERMEEVFKKEEGEIKIVEEFVGGELVGKKYKPTFDYFLDSNIENKENLYKIVDAEFVTLDTGTGIVHIAPAFGDEDFNLSKEKSLPIIKHVGMNGKFIKEVVDFAGMKVKTSEDNQSADIAIIKYLAAKGLLFSKEKIVHSYPTCWRCSTPLLNYLTGSWFVNVPKIKDKLLSENGKIKWVPEHIKEGRFGKWLEGARDWPVSRSRYWGAPLPIWKEIDGEEVKIISSLKELAENNFNKPKNEYYLMRHGEAYHNVNSTEETSMDPKNVLTELGIAQVEDARKKNEVNFDLIISSPFPRTRQTAEIMLDDKKDNLIVREDFREIDLGIYDKQPSEKIWKDYGIDYLKLNTKLGGGESHGDVMNRVMKGIYDLEKEYTGKKILIVTHGAPMRMGIAGSELYTEEELMADELSNDTRLYPRNAEIKKVDLKLVPRDDKGKINLHRPHIDEIFLKTENGKKMQRVEYVFDGWFESGSMPFSQVHYPFENKEVFKNNFPADFIAEGLDQTRGWFYLLLNMSVGIFDKASYKNVIVNGLLVAADGEKMSKSKNNYTDPLILVEKFGADAFRQTLLSSSVMSAENILFADANVEETYKKVVAKLLNVLTFYEMLEVSEHFEKTELKNPMDIWIFTRLAEVLENVTKNTSEYKLNDATRPFEKFVDDLSTWWLRRSRERLKGENGEEEKREAQYVLQKVLNETAKMFAPFMPFISEIIYLSVNKNNSQKRESVHLEFWPKQISEIKVDVLEEMEKVRGIVTEALMIRQKNNIPVRQPLSKLFTKLNIDEKYFEVLKEEINVKEILIDEKQNYDENQNTKLELELNEELKREGKYRELIRKIKDLRKENNLTPGDIVSLLVKSTKERIEFITDFSEELKKDTKLSEVKFEETKELEEFILEK